MDDSKIVELYFARNEQAIQETDRAYGRKLYVLVNKVLSNREDSEETVNDTYLQTRGPEEIAKVDEIREEYGLPPGIPWMEESVDIALNALGLEELVLPDPGIEASYFTNQAYYYRDGTFDITFTLQFTDENAAWRDPMEFRMRRVKNCL